MTKFSIFNEVKRYKPLALFLSPVVLPLINGSLDLSRRAVRLPPGVKVKQIRISATDQDTITLIIYIPEQTKQPSPALLYYYGSSFFLTRPPHIKRLTAEYALQTNAIVIDVDYRLSPQHPFPEPFFDALRASEWVLQHTGYLGIDPERIAIGGDSSGSTLANNVLLYYKDRNTFPFFYQFHIYPVSDARMRAESLHTFPFWSVKLNKMMWSLYIRDEVDLPNKYASPMEAASFAGLPDAYVEVCEYDPLRDEGLLFSEALQKDGVKVETHCVLHAFHSFDLLASSDLTKMMMQTRTEALNRAFYKKNG
ncbi:Acetyl esterase/lipase [Alkalibacterium subtropicum]|uniref:Acetyl esterase/lipase n=1 Tax=Alkalibacterium subtropicum TaxID=753702 RepID=A0A1I1KH77_9LACT|nr:alpha/beta hydrolase [Alkalibacterium subtropicum]SFC57473.1 Acetyl esterase/lipase [Alkalibacterium subtropicum]